MRGPRARDLGLPLPGNPGPYNAITDVPQIRVGMVTRNEGQAPLVVGQGPVRTGVTVILPRGYQQPLEGVWASYFRFNGNGEMTGTHWIADGGYFAGPICLTNTHSVGIVHHAATHWMIDQYPEAFLHHHMWAMPVVAETYDGIINDINGQHLNESDVLQALSSATDGWVEEGNCGGGAGMIAYGYKAGTGTSSRQVTIENQHYTVGVLVQANHGAPQWFEILGVPVGHRYPAHASSSDQGSIIVIIATDIPMMPHQLSRVARRATLGIGRQGTVGGNSSGDLFLAFSVANNVPMPNAPDTWLSLTMLHDQCFDAIYEAVVQSVEEAILNALVAAQSVESVKPPGVVPALDHNLVREVARKVLKDREPN